MCGERRDTPENEVSPEMIREGMAELSGYDPEFDQGGELVERIYLAMDEARRSRLSCGKSQPV